MKKAMPYFLSLVLLVSFLTGCGQGESSSTYFESSSAEVSESFGTVKGTIHLQGNSGTFLYVDMNQNYEAGIDYALERAEGNIEVYYQAPDGTKTLLIDTSDTKEDSIEGSCTVSLQEGIGKFYMAGDSGTFDFDFKLNAEESNFRFFDIMSPETQNKQDK